VQAVDMKKPRAIADVLRERFQYFQTTNLRGIEAVEFRAHIEARIGTTDARSEGYDEAETAVQRDLSTEFHWGYDHDFGDFQLTGKMRNRHIGVLANFATLFPVTIEDFDNRDVFDVGCWTGGTTLVLASLGSRVVAIEEVRKYAEMAAFLAKSFGLEDRVKVEPRSLYSCNSPEFHDRFDIVHFPGVVYHLSDPVVGLRILYNSLRIGGRILVESAGINVAKPLCRFWGNKSVQRDAHSGWAWFWPSPSALARMMKEAGFDQIRSVWHPGLRRVYAFGVKAAEVAIVKAGLSVQDIR